ncbi:polysaccharide deacetylase family protein [Streptomyces sp. GC420]|uniref:polysaccharide deacetylase family protein n=1 Tax=Streptomyces sp. GC420 TaxID=2697568 RepID=UPI001414E519|nr:polysaccharide deacetylase family protein [Streptomyces sp. GC420]NBM21141.1 polysaccharide deacetylase family protein [Streptomyces sp. GC420]
MKKDEILMARRLVLRGAAGLGMVATGWAALGIGGANAPHRVPAAAPGAGSPAGSPAAPAPAGGAPPEGVSGVRVRPATAYRLQPMTAYSPPKYRPMRPPVRSRPFLRLDADTRGMVLTFDDGPDPRYTPEVLRVLRRYDVRAMFFVVGEMADAHRDLVRRVMDEGHVVGNHSWSHPLMTRLSPTRIREELTRTSEVIEEAAGEPPRWYRAPYGAWNGVSFKIGAELGMEPLAWTVDTLDWRAGASAHRIARAVIDGAGPGVVVLSHDAGGNRRASVLALRSYLPALLDSGHSITLPPEPGGRRPSS